MRIPYIHIYTRTRPNNFINLICNKNILGGMETTGEIPETPLRLLLCQMKLFSSFYVCLFLFFYYIFLCLFFKIVMISMFFYVFDIKIKMFSFL